MEDGELVSDSSIVALCVDFSAALNEWDSGLFISFDFGEHCFLFVILLNLTGADLRTRSSSLAEKATSLPPKSARIDLWAIVFGRTE
jgi:hypothetical protein